MSQARKRRGRATEHLVAQAFAADGWPYALATGAGTPGRDVTGVPGVAIEVKARAGFEPMANLRQARGHAVDGEIPVVVMRPNGYGETTIDDWPAFITFRDLRWLLTCALGTETPATTRVGEQEETPMAKDSKGPGNSGTSGGTGSGDKGGKRPGGTNTGGGTGGNTGGTSHKGGKTR